MGTAPAMKHTVFAQYYFGAAKRRTNADSRQSLCGKICPIVRRARARSLLPKQRRVVNRAPREVRCWIGVAPLFFRLGLALSGPHAQVRDGGGSRDPIFRARARARLRVPDQFTDMR
jgi:hypothetical protein